MKRIAALALTAVMTLSLAACGGGSSKENTVNSAEDLPGKTIGVQLGTTGDILSTEYEEADDGTKVERFSKGSDAVQSLIQGKIDCVVIDAQPAKAFVEKNDGLRILDEPLTEEEYAIAIAKDNTELKEKINQALAELKEDGTLEAIESNYIGDEDTVGKNPYESPADVDRSNGELIMATNAAFEPYEYYQNNQNVGIDPDMAQAIADKLGMELKIEDMEFDSIVTAVQSGKADIGVAGMTVTEDRLKNIDFTDTYTTAAQVIIVRE